jgi:alpha-D-xyloside xylohydrolase
MKIFYLFVALFAISMLGSAQNWQKTNLGVKAEVNAAQVEIQFFSPTIVRVQKWPKGTTFNKESLSVIKTAQDAKLKITQKADDLILKSESMVAVFNLKSGKVSFQNAKGDALLNEKEAGATFTDFNDAGVKTYSVGQSFVLDKDETIYGLGILQNGKMSQRIKKFAWFRTILGILLLSSNP